MRDGLDPNKNEAYEEDREDKDQYKDAPFSEWDDNDDSEDGEVLDWFEDHEYYNDPEWEESHPTNQQKSLFDMALYKTEVRNLFHSIKLFFNRVFMGNKRYLDLLDKEKSLSQVKSGVVISTEPEYVDAKASSGAVLMRWVKAIQATIHIDVSKILSGIGVKVNDGVKWEITGVPEDVVEE
jgi:hypothetical protein